MQNKLRIIGLRPINNVVDITNYIVHAFGQPLHCFDADRIKGGEVIVKTLPRHSFTTLDGVERKLNGRDLMICNREEPMCIAGCSADWIQAPPKPRRTSSSKALISPHLGA